MDRSQFLDEPHSPMPSKPNKPIRLKQLSPPIDSLFRRIRSRIRIFVLVEGIALTIAFFLLTFWLTFGLDYGPVPFGYSETSSPIRTALLVAAIGVVIAAIYRWIARRIFVPLKNSSIAMLIERQYPAFNDSLLTTVDRCQQQESQLTPDQQMLVRTQSQAESLIEQVELPKIASSKPVQRSLIAALSLVLATASLGFLFPNQFAIAGQRFYLLDNQPWPRRCRLEMVGLKVKRDNPVEGIAEMSKIVEPIDGIFPVAQGASVTILVRAAAGSAEQNGILPESCWLTYQTSGGTYGTKTFSKIGAPRDGFQAYSLDDVPFRGILDDIQFYVRGGDDRMGPFKVSVVDQPIVVQTELVCRYPKYLQDENSLRWTDRTLQWTGQAAVPAGTHVTVKMFSNKPLQKVYAFNTTADQTSELKLAGDSFSFELLPIHEKTNLQFYLCDTDGIVAERPHVIDIDPIEDLPPTIETKISGIGTAITPDAIVPIFADIQDDYGLAKSWLEIEPPEGELIEIPINVESDGKLETELDFRQRRTGGDKRFDLPTGDSQVVSLVLKSHDRYDLRNQPNEGVGDRFDLDVVSADELLRILERLEVGQRRRLEQIYSELSDAKDYLVRTQSSHRLPDDQWLEPGDETTTQRPGEAQSETQLRRRREFRLLFCQRAILQIEKSRQEILGCADAFESIRLQLINNRLDAEDRKKRFSDQIISPLRLLGDESMQKLISEGEQLEGLLRELLETATLNQADQQSSVAIEQADLVLRQLDQILNILLKFETQNELLDIVRQIKKLQNSILERTKKERQRKAFDDLLN